MNFIIPPIKSVGAKNTRAKVKIVKVFKLCLYEIKNNDKKTGTADKSTVIPNPVGIPINSLDNDRISAREAKTTDKISW